MRPSNVHQNKPLACALLESSGLPRPVAEHQFHPGRRWRFDFAWVEYKVALEVEGGIYGRGKKCPACGQRKVGAHTSIERLKTDMEKYFYASLLGWVVARCLPEEFTGMVVLDRLRLALAERGWSCDSVPFSPG